MADNGTGYNGNGDLALQQIINRLDKIENKQDFAQQEVATIKAMLAERCHERFKLIDSQASKHEKLNKNVNAIEKSLTFNKGFMAGVGAVAGAVGALLIKFLGALFP